MQVDNEPGLMHAFDAPGVMGWKKQRLRVLASRYGGMAGRMDLVAAFR